MGSTFQCHIHKLKVLQKKAIRCISGAKYNAHSDPIFKQLSILKFDDIYKLSVAKIMLTYVREELPTPLQSIFRFDRLFVCWSLTSLCHSNGHIETMPAREINPFTALTRIRSQFLRQWTRQRFRPLSHRGWP